MSWSNHPPLDGIRTIAVYLVVLFHCGIAAFGGGYIGVDLFFVLSGFLLTNVILTDIDQHGSLRFGWFYSRRVRRLLPAALAAILAIAVTFLLVTSVVRRLPLVADARSALLYVANWHFLNAQNDYFATNVAKSPYLHFWSLSIEEQFYVFYPALLLVLARLSRRNNRALYLGLGALFALSLAAQVYWARVDLNHAYYGTDARVYQLFAGALLACALRSWEQVRFGPATRLATPLGSALLLLFGSGLWDLAPSWRGIAATAGGVLLIAGVMMHGGDVFGRSLGRPIPVYLGRISYGTYLWHWPVILVITEFLDLPSWVLAVFVGVIATGLAALSYQVLEMPIRRAPALSAYQWQTVTAGVAASVVIAAVLVAPILRSDHSPRLAAAASGLRGFGTGATSDAKWFDRPAPKDWDFDKLAKDIGPQRTCGPDDPDSCVVVRGSGPTIALVGDSHARLLAPMFIKLAQEHDLTLVMSVYQGCPWQADIVKHNDPRSEQDKCRQARDVWYEDVLPELAVDVVFISTFHRENDFWAHELQRRGGSDETLPQLLTNTSNETLDVITGTGAKVVLFNDMLDTPDQADPLECLAEAKVLGDCAVPVPLQAPLSDAIARTVAATRADVYTLDLNPIACPDAPVCAPVIDGINVWREGNHMSTQIFVHFRDQVWQAIRSLGVLG